ncbi:cadherin-99C-like isoform X2 [Mercenaria mercenaria]|uniref:cadherin-99C-like isoform X2 n=1 Tax=Mercenaria mercenaria TaxID=6596 RepID=UPI00234E4288|nr:cadherin-99C-like isoform X2 [Mercenaria mercenaria]
MAICNFLTLAVVFALLQLKFTTGQKPSPQTNPCMIYDLKTGNIEGGASVRVDIYEERNQTVILPISGGKNISLEVNAEDAKKFGVSMGFNGTYVTMSLSKAVDRDGTSILAVDDFDVFSLDVICRHQAASNTQPKYISVTVMVKDINDNAPEFVNSKYSAVIQETLPLRSSVFQLTAEDKDAGLYGAIYFSIISGNKFAGKTYFNIPDAQHGEVELSSRLDFDTKEKNIFVLSVIAVDGAVDAAERKTSTATLTIFVEDSDDLPPTFYHDKCRHTSPILHSCDAVIYRTELISGNMVPGALLMLPVVAGHDINLENITAFDMDNLNAAIAFELIGSAPSGFANHIMVSSSGPTTNKNLGTHEVYTATLRQIRTVTRHETKEFSLFLKAKQTDDESKYCIAQIMFTIIPSNFNYPVVMTNVDGNVGYIAEDAPSGTIVRTAASGEVEPLEIRVTDADLIAGDTQRYDYTIDSTGSKFSIQSYGDRAIILETQPLAYSEVSRYALKVKVTERTAEARTAAIIIGVIIQSRNDSTYEKKSGNLVCSDGLYGQYCNRTCPANCARCTSNTHCLECAQGFYGTICSLSCSRNCLFCNKTDGSCIGFLNCDNKNSTYEKKSGNLVCSDGLYGQYCNRTCPANCARCTSHTHCLECAQGFYGTICSLSCSRKCLFCTKTDGSCIGFLNCDIINNEIDEKGETCSVLTLILVAVGSSCGMLVIAAFIVIIRRGNVICCGKRHGVNSGDSQINTVDYENDTPLEHYERLGGTNEENKPYDVLKTAEYEALGERTKEEQQYEGLNISKS